MKSNATSLCGVDGPVVAQPRTVRSVGLLDRLVGGGQRLIVVFRIGLRLPEATVGFVPDLPGMKPLAAKNAARSSRASPTRQVEQVGGRIAGDANLESVQRRDPSNGPEFREDERTRGHLRGAAFHANFAKHDGPTNGPRFFGERPHQPPTGFGQGNIDFAPAIPIDRAQRTK